MVAQVALARRSTGVAYCYNIMYIL